MRPEKAPERGKVRGRLLIVDDELANLQKLRRTFTQDFAVVEAHSGEEALKLLADCPFDVIIADQRMPGISGVDLLRESFQLNPLSIRIILTGYTEIDYLMDAINKGHVHRYVTKPWEPFSLRQTVLQDLELTELRRERQRLSEQLRIAREVQTQLLPRHLPLLKGLDYAVVCRPAREVGGDYYDFLQYQAEQLWFAVGDISGKGISAALLMANLQALLRSRAPLHGRRIESLVTDVNRLMLDSTGEAKYATLFCGLFDGGQRVLHYVNAGHCNPLLVRKTQEDGVQVRPLSATGTVVGLFPGAPYRKESLRLELGDTLAVFTDGIPEAFPVGGLEPFGEERLKALLARHAALPVRNLLDLILSEVENYGGGSEVKDDLTLLLLRVTDEGSGGSP